MSGINRWCLTLVVALGAGIADAAAPEKRDGRLKLVEAAPHDELDSVTAIAAAVSANPTARATFTLRIIRSVVRG